MEKEELVVAGFSFETLEDAELAREEEKKIEYIESRINYSKPEGIVPIYKKIVDSAMFQTPVGYLYLHGLYEFLNQNSEEEIPAITTKRLEDPIIPKARQDKKITKLKEEKGDLRKNLKFSVILNIFLVLAIIIMFVITLKGSNANILNYERVIQDKYSQWEQELQERERIIREKEKDS